MILLAREAGVAPLLREGEGASIEEGAPALVSMKKLSAKKPSAWRPPSVPRALALRAISTSNQCSGSAWAQSTARLRRLKLAMHMKKPLALQAGGSCCNRSCHKNWHQWRRHSGISGSRASRGPSKQILLRLASWQGRSAMSHLMR